MYLEKVSQFKIPIFPSILLVKLIFCLSRLARVKSRISLLEKFDNKTVLILIPF